MMMDPGWELSPLVEMENIRQVAVGDADEQVAKSCWRTCKIEGVIFRDHFGQIASQTGSAVGVLTVSGSSLQYARS